MLLGGNESCLVTVINKLLIGTEISSGARYRINLKHVLAAFLDLLKGL